MILHLTRTLRFPWCDVVYSAVTVDTSFSPLEPFFDVKRRVRGYKYEINVKMPNLINSFNKHMGGMDHHDWLDGLYSIKIHS
ncbi:hypothetical protein TNCT_378071 [Trichonephila clavata]|uniref:Uncharacterized protein n=1 Tax=Trichonephila clavata TaxID=2740835 RepID=A0A8X6KCZ3_TRICU|nr:hypothetical protein TNCT_378071 [Trichonephila clavata]